jgi:hypothetical protein
VSSRLSFILHALPFLGLLGCPADPVDRIPDPEDSGDTAGDGDDGPPPVYPDGDRILLYYGHGGPSPDESGLAQFDLVDHHWKDSFGWNSDYRSYLPDALDDYRAVFFIGPGSSAEVSFDPAELERLRAALAAGTRMIIVTDKEGCAAYAPNELLEGLGSSLRVNDEGLGDYQIAEIDQIAEHQATAGVEALRFRDPCGIDMGDARYLARYDDLIMVGIDRPGSGGEVILVGDYEFMDDSGPREWADNGLFADRLVQIDPSYAEE